MSDKPLSMVAFALVALSPLVLIGAGAWQGGVWVWAGFLYMGALVLVLDQMIPHVAGNVPEGTEFPAADTVLVAVGLGAATLLPTAVWGITSDHLSWGEKVLLFLGTGYFMGHVAHPAAHELIHRPNRWLFRLGAMIYAMLLFGHHASAHRLVHHPAVATPDDPNSARPGESFWRFAPRAWIGGFRKGKDAEDALRARRQGTRGVHPYVWYACVAAASVGLAMGIGGLSGAMVWIALSAHAQLQQLLADYVQHYGLTRMRLPDGRYEPVTNRHSWNTPHWFSSALMLNAPRHSDHHAHPGRPYPALRLTDDAPMLPWPLPLACALAMVPRLWRRLMRPHLRRWERSGPQNPAV